MVLTAGGVFLSVLAFLSQYNELDCEENKLEVRLFDKQYLVSYTKIHGKYRAGSRGGVVGVATPPFALTS